MKRILFLAGMMLVSAILLASCAQRKTPQKSEGWMIQSMLVEKLGGKESAESEESLRRLLKTLKAEEQGHQGGNLYVLCEQDARKVQNPEKGLIRKLHELLVQECPQQKGQTTLLGEPEFAYEKNAVCMRAQARAHCESQDGKGNKEEGDKPKRWGRVMLARAR